MLALYNLKDCMRIWDLNPGYLNRQSLLGEHRELHGLVSITKYNKKGYSKHPETLRWIGLGWALKQRHKLLVAEMNLRGYTDKSPVLLRSKPGVWPKVYIDEPGEQINILKEKYKHLESGRISLPKNAQELWAHHKYSVMARSITEYKNLGKWVTTKSGATELHKIAIEVTDILRQPPEERLIENTLLHMWGYVSKYSSISSEKLNSLSNKALLKNVQQLSISNNVTYLINSTSLSELNAWSI